VISFPKLPEYNMEWMNWLVDSERGQQLLRRQGEMDFAMTTI
jgi:hypothetical protein